MSEKSSPESHSDQISTQRLEAFSDGVFAIAITLLILEVKIPNHEDLNQSHGLKNFLLQLWPSYFAYVFSFIIIGIYWANHHYLFHMFKRTNHVFNMLNVLFLMCIAFLPYPTAILGDFISDPELRPTAVSLYALGILLPSMTWLILWLYGSYHYRLIDSRLDKSFVKMMTRQYYLSNVFYLLALVISFFNPIASICINILLTLLYLFPPKRPQYKKNEE